MTHRPEELALVALAAHARDVSSEQREAFAEAAAAVARDPRAVLLHTCHRAELYVVDEPFSDRVPLTLPDLPPGGRRLQGWDAVRHLLSFAAGLDSVVVAEDQSLHQLRDCVSHRQRARRPRGRSVVAPTTDRTAALHPVLERLLQVALHVGRETRSQREGPPRSLADVALDRLAPFTGPLLGRRVLIVGAGRMARLAALSASRQGAHVLVANRSHDRAAALAHDARGEPAAFGSHAPLPATDALVLAISGTWPLSPSARAELIAADIPVVDLSSPPALDADLRDDLGTRYVGVDDLARGPQDELRARLQRRFARAIEDAETSFQQWLHSRSAVPAIQALSDRAETQRVLELERLFRRTDLPAHQREMVEQMSRRLVAGLLHRPLVTLKEDADGDLERAARTLFSL